MTRIAHISDLHFGAEDPQVVAGLLAELNADRPDLVAISGDLTLDARYREFIAARAFMDALHSPTLVVPGNHDIPAYKVWERFSDPYGRWRATIGPETEPQWQNEEVVVVGLNTARRLGWHWDWSRGRVTHARLRRLVERLAAVPAGLTRVVVAHHPLLPPEYAPKTPVAGGAAMALSVLSNNQVRLVLAGHLHRGYARLAKPAGPSPLILQGATATSVRLRGEPNAYNRLTIGAGGTVDVDTRIWNGTGWTSRSDKTLPSAEAVEGRPVEEQLPSTH